MPVRTQVSCKSMASAVKKGASAVRRRKERKGEKMGIAENKKGEEENKCKLLKYEELPEYMKDNEFIVKYYRAEWPLKQAFFSLFQWHNETLNTWTHLVGFLVFLWLTIANALPVPDAVNLFGIIRYFPGIADASFSHGSRQLLMFEETTKAIFNHTKTAPSAQAASLSPDAASRWPFYVFLTGSMFCLLSSSVCHLFSCHSHHVNTLLLRIDYVGITTMIITSFFPPVYYIFLCQPLYQLLYLSGISLFGVFTILTLLAPALSSGDRRGFRALLFCSMGLFGLIPATHACVINWGSPRRGVTLAYEAAMALSYLTGTAFYVSRVPERFRPGWFDLAGHSHQIFHVFVVMGALAHYGAGLLFLQHRDMIGCDQTTLLSS